MSRQATQVLRCGPPPSAIVTDMTLYQGILAGRIVLLVVLAGLFLSLALGVARSRALRIVALTVLAGALLGYVNFGILHPTRSGYRAGHIHYYDAFHYFMGAKYLPELGYSGLYETTLVAGRDLGAFASIAWVRDLTTYAPRPAASVNAAAVRARFTNERWRMFTEDLAFFGPRIDAWPELLVDRGYNDPPPRALLLHRLVGRIPANSFSLTLLTSLDYILLIVAFGAVWATFGETSAALALAFFSLSFFARFDFIGGSILRWDWIASLMIGVSALKRGRGAAAGVFLGYAAIARVFPALLMVPLMLKRLPGRAEKSRDALTSCLCAALSMTVLASVSLIASADHRTLALDFLSKIRLHAQDPFINSVGLGSLIVFGSTPWHANPDGTVFVTAEAIAAARPGRYLLPLVSIGYLLLVFPLIRRARTLESMMYGVPLIYCILSPTGYYYSFLVLLVLLPWREGGGADRISLVEMALLTGTTIGIYAFELVSPDFIPLFYHASVQLGIFFAAWIAFEYVRLGFLGRPSPTFGT